MTLPGLSSRRAGPPSSRSPVRGRSSRQNLFSWSFFAPAVILVTLVSILPIYTAAELSLRDTEFLQPGRFVGLDNYARFFSDELSVVNVVRTAIFTVASIAITFPLAIWLALVLNRKFRGRTLVRTLLILPWVISQLLAGLMWKWAVSPDIGPIGYVLGALTNTRVDALSEPTSAMVALIVANVWRTYPYAMILTLAALQSIPNEVRESAKVEGASPWQELRHVTLPLIKNTLLVALIILTVNAINMVDLPLVMTGGGPVSATDLLGLRVYREAFTLEHIGFASAISMVMFLINIVVSLVYIRVVREDTK